MSDTEPLKLVLHIGAHKTGTSAIQVYLNQANVQLMNQGWVFAPQPEGALNWSPMIGMRQVPDGGQFHLRSEVYPGFLRRLRARRRHLIVSAEDMFFLEPDQIARLGADLREMTPDITIIAYLRRQDRMALSQWAQGGKTIQSAAVFGCQDSQLRPLTAQMRGYLDYAARLDQWRAEFPQARFIIRIYDRRNFPGGDVVQDFLQILGLSTEGITLPDDINAAFGATTVQMFYWLRAQGFTQPEIQAIIQRRVVEETTDRALPSRAEVAAFLEPFADSNRRLSDLLGLDHAFDMDLSEYPEVSTFRPLPEAFKLRALTALALSLREGLRTEG